MKNKKKIFKKNTHQILVMKLYFYCKINISLVFILLIQMTILNLKNSFYFILKEFLKLNKIVFRVTLIVLKSFQRKAQYYLRILKRLIQIITR